MTSCETKMRFEELCAGRAMGDLSLEEDRELAILSEELGVTPDLAFELLATELEVELLQKSIEPLPAALAARLHQCADKMSAPTVHNVIVPNVPAWQKIIRNPVTGWAAAAAILIFAALNTQKLNTTLSPIQAEARLRTEASDLIERKFQGQGTFKDTSGQVVWSDSKQQGYMTLSGIPKNDPKKSQYQLWIVDPKRDEAPVDGGVFDIPSDGSSVVVPIAAKLALSNPQAFVITLEQPGGVVKSKQEQVVALAKN